MAVAKDHLPSLGYFTVTDRNTFTKQKDHALKKSREMRLQQRWYELREREFMAKQHNTELLKQFDEAQNELQEILIRTAAMKTLRMEYERYLGENYPQGQQQLKEKTQATPTKRIEECLKTRVKNSDLGKPPTNVSAPQGFDHSQDSSSYRRLMQSSWLTQSPSQTALSPNGVHIQAQDLSHVSPLFLKPPLFPHLQPFQQHHLSPSPYHHPLPQQGPPSGWASHRPDYPWFHATAAGGPSCSEPLLGQFFMDEPPLESRVSVMAREEAEANRAVKSMRESGGDNRSGHLSEELDVKPVRLSSGQAEISESSGESSRGSREKRKKRKRRTEMNPDRESHSSPELSQASSAAVIVSAAVSKSSESDVSENSSRRMTRREGLALESPKMLKTEQSKEGDSGSNSTGEESGSQTEGSVSEEAQSPLANSESSSEESGSQREELPGKMSMKPKNEARDEKEKQGSSSSGQISEEDMGEEEEDQENNTGNEEGAEEKESSPGEEEDEDDDGEGSTRTNTTGEEEAAGAEHEESEDQEDDEEHSGSEDGRKESSSSQGEDEGSEEKMEGEGSDGEEQRSDKIGVEEERDSDDIIISPQENRYKKIHVIPEEAAEDERMEENIMPPSDDEDDGDEGSDEHNEDDDIELLLAPPDQTQKKEEMEVKADEILKVCDMVQRFHVEDKDESIKSDSDEFDNFYD